MHVSDEFKWWSGRGWQGTGWDGGKIPLIRITSKSSSGLRREGRAHMKQKAGSAMKDFCRNPHHLKPVKSLSVRLRHLSASATLLRLNGKEITSEPRKDKGGQNCDISARRSVNSET
jgi:hypothetical protein